MKQTTMRKDGVVTGTATARFRQAVRITNNKIGLSLELEM
jgi:hypothetical protein